MNLFTYGLYIHAVIQTYFSRTFQNLKFLMSRTFQDQSDFPGLSRSWNFPEKIQDFLGSVGTLITEKTIDLALRKIYVLSEMHTVTTSKAKLLLSNSV